MPGKLDPSDIVGNLYGKLTVCAYAGRDSRGCHQYECKCSCGNQSTLIIRRDALMSGNTQSCGCIRHERIDVADLIGKQYGGVVVTGYNGHRGVGTESQHYYKCHCNCGNDFEVSRKLLLTGRISKCGNCGKIVKEGDHYRYICINGIEWEFDEIDLDLVQSLQWHSSDGRYPYTYIGGTQKAFHQLAMDIPDGMRLDHIDGNTLNNRRSNFRLASALENARNRCILPFNTSGYKGVSCYHKKKVRPYRAQIKVNGKSTHLGYFNTPIEAARAYDKAARIYFGEFACLNFPDDGEQGCRRNDNDAHTPKSA